MQELDQRDRELLSTLQSGLPLVSTPYALIGQDIDMSEKEVIKRCERLKRDGTIGQISAVFDGRGLGYRSCLVAARVEPDALERAASLVNLHPGVYQNYRRNHEFNMWFTIAVPPNSRIGLEKTIEILGDESGCDVVRLLPTIRTFKNPGADSSDSFESASAEPASLSARDLELVRLLQTDLPLQPRPFEAWARQGAFSSDEILEFARRLLETQQIRRFAASVQLRKPFSATAMGVWRIPEDRIDDLVPKMADRPSVSQCYLRPVYEDWPYNIFTTVHGRSVDECESVLNEISEEIGIASMQVLFPTKEYKRSHIVYFSGEVDAWEAQHLQPTRSAVS
ncbi:MAG: Lrp/AsnC family transcriptional regulator [Thermoanaerobaculia bacterium]